MANARKQIEAKKAQLGLKTESVSATDEKKAKLLELKAKLAASAATAQIQNIMQQKLGLQEAAQQEAVIQRIESMEERERSLNLIIDSEGRTIDKRTGEVVQIQSRVPTLKANLKAQKRDYKTAMGNDMFGSGIASTIPGMSSVYPGGVAASQTPVQPEADKDMTDEKFFDPRLMQKTAERNKRKLVFNEKGKYEDIANKMRTKTKLQMLQQEITSISKRTGISAESKLALIQPKRMMVYISYIFCQISRQGAKSMLHKY
jgi:U4/U6 small nuclear ribonucleoprotein PRP3